MHTDAKKVLTLAERPWASRLRYRRFLGTYELEAKSGIYFAEGTPAGKKRAIARAFLKLPAQLQELSRQFQVTISTCNGLTENDNSSTSYSDFQQRSKSKVSPHIEIGSRSMAPRMLSPHLTHEICHLWWRHLDAEERAAYSKFLTESCDAGTVEVTDYVDDFFRDWLKSLAIPDSESYARNHRKSYLEKWAEESFCDTVARLAFPDYPSSRADCNINLAKRRSKIRKLTGLRIKHH